MKNKEPQEIMKQILSLPPESKALVLDFIDLLLIYCEYGKLPPVPPAKGAAE